jgi:hypothetical protein
MIYMWVSRLTIKIHFVLYNAKDPSMEMPLTLGPEHWVLNLCTTTTVENHHIIFGRKVLRKFPCSVMVPKVTHNFP